VNRFANFGYMQFRQPGFGPRPLNLQIGRLWNCDFRSAWGTDPGTVPERKFVQTGRSDNSETFLASKFADAKLVQISETSNFDNLSARWAASGRKLVLLGHGRFANPKVVFFRYASDMVDLVGALGSRPGHL
jgi:hypothetical protein